MLPVANTNVIAVENESEFSAADEPRALCIIRDTTNGSHKSSLNLPISTTTVQLMEEVGRQCSYYPDSFELVWQRMPDGEQIVINEQGDQTLEELGFRHGESSRNMLIILKKDGESPREMYSENDSRGDLKVKGSSGENYRSSLTSPPSYSPSGSDCSYNFSSNSTYLRHDTGYVGLVNQASTCYLNSLLQTLYMTPEFRNALYRWESTADINEESYMKSIPFQLQKLFLQLQTSKKVAVGTTELTKSFGWDSSESWQQHDVQELCRVMFDALEQNFKNTDQADLISRYYEGKLKDYVRCLECGHESAREDTFLDIPLVVRPWGSNQSYGSVEEALRAFVTPETLEGSNQYLCAHCDKKCDAHKGLKFVKFPYLLTLQLKRFDFDPATMHRIKLNDRVTFPDILNLNEFVKSESQDSLDDGDTTDSGSAFDDDVCCPNSNNKAGTGSVLSSEGGDEIQDNQEDDEGIDVDHPSHSLQEACVNEKNLQKSGVKGPYIYELFSIMVHSGNANGGHYAANIKSFQDGHWYCFNDTQVTRITYDDIRKTYGGGPSRGFYSSAYSSSTNAYMLMYRMIDKEVNTEPMTQENFPSHITNLLLYMQEEEERERQQKELDKSMCKIKLFCHHPSHYSRLIEMRLKIHKDDTLAESTAVAHKIMELEEVVPLECCRLVKYDEFHDSLESSFEGMEEERMEIVLGGVKTSYKFDLLLEIRQPNEEFKVYKEGGTTVKVFVVNLDIDEVAVFPVTVRGYLNQNVDEFKSLVAEKLNLPSPEMRMVLERYYSDLRLLSTPNKTLKSEGFYISNKVFVEYKDKEDAEMPFLQSRLHAVLDRYEHTICIQITLPHISKEVLNRLGIGENGEPKVVLAIHSEDNPGNEDLDHCVVTNGSSSDTKPTLEDEMLPDYEDSVNEAESGDASYPTQTVYSDQSEDSSLTDSERTLVGEELSPRNNSPEMNDDFTENDYVKNETGQGDQNLKLMPDKLTRRAKYSNNQEGGELQNDDADIETSEQNDASQLRPEPRRYFRAWPYRDPETNEKVLKVILDKRITFGALKREVANLICVHSEHFKIYRVYSHNHEFECLRLQDDLSSYGNNSRLVVKLARALRTGEYRVKVYQLLVNEPEPGKYLIDWIFPKGITVLQLKKEIISELQDQKIDIPVNRCRLRKKYVKIPGKIYQDDYVFEEENSDWEIYLEHLTDAEKVTNTSFLSLFIRRWQPSSLFLLNDIEELVLEERTYEELKSKLSKHSEIPEDNLELAKVQSTSSRDIMDPEWHSQISSLQEWPLDLMEDGTLFYYRDKTESQKYASEDQSDKERHRSSRKSKLLSYSPRKERALKIYTEASSPVSPVANDSTADLD